MKKIITTVGTSLITNLLKQSDGFITNGDVSILEGRRYNESNKPEIERRIEQLYKKIEKNLELQDASFSAESASLIKIAGELKEHVDVYLLATDTILSPICAEIIRKWFDIQKFNSEHKNLEYFNSIHFEANPRYIIQGLQVKNKDDFERQGLTNLFNRFHEIAENGYFWDNCMINITGGYKALIPFISLIAQINSIPVFYTFQEKNDEKFDLLSIPGLPINLDFELFEKYWEIISLVSEEGKYIENYEFQRDMKNILEVPEGSSQMLTMLGYALWEKFKSKFFLFYCPDDVWEEINKQQDILRIIQNKFWNHNARNNKTERKKKHLVFDDGDNNNRIYFFQSEQKIYIYKTFENEERARDFIVSDLRKDNIIHESSLRKIEIM